jgi:uncharacterized damage-inducible protein DinB
MKFAISILLLSGVTFAASPQAKEQASNGNANPVTSALRQMEQRFAKNIAEAAEAMPADKYSYKPTQDQMTFGHLMTHVAEANNNFCAAIGGQSAAKMDESSDKDKLVTAVKNSFSFCEQILGKADDTNLGQMVTLFKQETTRGAAMLRLASSWGDHYGAAAMYLRLNGVLPPTAKSEHK